MNKIVGVSLPEETLTEIDSKRGDISRSRYLMRLVEIGLKMRGPDKRTDDLRGKNS